MTYGPEHGVGVRVTGLFLAGGIALAGAGCSAEQNAIPQPSAGTSASPEATHIGAPGVCIEPGKNDPNAVTKAERCLQAMRGGRVTLVDFGLPDGVAEEIAKDVPVVISEFTAGSVTVQTTVVDATPKAKEAYNKTFKKACASPKGAQDYAAAAAETQMPEKVKKADFVVALTTAVNCAQGRGGLASTDLRHADIYTGFYMLTASPEAWHSKAMADVLSSLTSHEILHLFGLGHAGRIYTPTESGPPRDINGAQEIHVGQPTINLDNYLKTALYAEYGDSTNVMGITNRQDIRSNPIDNAYLDWPNRITKQAEARNQAVDATNSVALDAAAAQEGLYASAKLEKPIRLHSTDDDQKPGPLSNVTFNNIALVPRFGENGENYGVELFLTAPGNIIARVGLLGPQTREAASSTLVCGGTKLTVRTEGGRIFVSQAA